MKISCIIPTCDRPEFLLETIKSVIGQTLSPYEIIIVNNGKKQVNLTEEIKEKVYVYNIKPYAGVSCARNYGAKLATGDFLAFIDDDDLWSKKYLENAAKAIQKGAECVLSRVDQLIDGKISPLKNPHNKITINNILTYNPGTGGSNIVISKDIFFHAGGFDVNLTTSEDKSLILEVLRRGIEVKTLPDNQIIARMDDYDRLTNASKVAAGCYKFTRKYADFMNKKQYLQNWQKIFRYRYEAGSKMSFIYFIFLYAINKLIKALPGLTNNLEKATKKFLPKSMARVLDVRHRLVNYYGSSKNFFDENIIFFRNDDVYEITPKLKKILNVFISHKIPLDLGVIPGKINSQAAEYLLELKDRHPDLIHFHQHGYMHKNYGADSKYEFGEGRNYDEQYNDIKKGWGLMNQYFKNPDKIFSPPHSRFNSDTVKVLEKLGFACLSAVKYISGNKRGLREVPIKIDVIDYQKPFSLKKYAIIKSEIRNALSQNKIVGIALHHELLSDDEFNYIEKILDVLKKKK